jgi:uncharacterized protein YidB (DUF937 family)
MLQAVIAMLAQGGLGQGGGNGGLGGALGGLGGLGGLVAQFQKAGLGEVVGSWIGTGHNLPISGDQLGSVLGPDVIGQLAQQLGLSHGEAQSQLSQILPQVVDKLTPNGQLPDPSSGGLGDIGSLLERFGR